MLVYQRVPITSHRFLVTHQVKMRNLSPLRMATRLRRAVREISSTLTSMPHSQSVQCYSMHILFQYLSIMYLSSLIFFTSTVSSASDSTLKHLKPRIASLSTEAIRYNAPWQPPAPDSSSGRCGHLKALVNMLFTTTLGIIDFFPIAGS